MVWPSSSFHIGHKNYKEKRYQKSTYRFAIWGPKTYNLLNLLSLPDLSDIQIWVTFYFQWHFSLSDMAFWVLFHFEWVAILSDILIGVKF